MFAKLEYGTRFKIADQEYEIRKLKEGGFGCDIEVHNITYDSLELLNIDDLLKAYNNKSLSFAIDDQDHQRAAVKWDLDLYSPEQRQEMYSRYAIIEPYLIGNITDLKSYLSNYPATLRPKSTPVLSTATFYRWVERFRKRESKVDLIPLKTGPKGRHVPEDIIIRLRDFIQNTDKVAESKTVRDKWAIFVDGLKEDNLHRDKKNELPLISESTFRRVYNEFHDFYPRDKKIMGVSQADLKLKGVREGLNPQRPLEYVELDWTPLDYIIVDFETGETSRPIVLHAVDKYSDEPLGYSITFKENPNAGDWKQLLLHVMLPKTDVQKLYPKVKGKWSAFGKPENIILDNASVNDSDEIEEVCGALNIGLIFNEKAAGHQKGNIEKALGDLNRIFHGFSGTTFSNNKERGQYDPHKEACVDINGLHHMLHVAIVDLVANRYNRGKGGYPEDIWNQGLKNSHVHRTLPYRREYLELLFASETQYRTLNPKGIELKGEFFYSEEVNRLRLRLEKEGKDRRVRVRFGADIRVVYVFDEFNKRYLAASLKQSSKLTRFGVDQRFPVHAEHLEQLCNHNNSNADSFRKKNNTAKALLALDDIVEQGKKDFTTTKRERARQETSQISIASAITGASDKILLVPDNPNVIIIESNESTIGSSQKERSSRKVINDTLDKETKVPSVLTDDIDLADIASGWGTGRKVHMHE